MSGRVAHRDRLRRKPTVELDEALSSPSEVRRVRSTSYSPVRMASSPLQEETKIARDFSIVTLEVDPLEDTRAGNGNGSDAHSGSDPKLSDELFSWRNRNGAANGPGNGKEIAQSSAASEDLVSMSSDMSDVSSVVSSEGGSRPSLSRRPVSQRLKSAGISNGVARDKERDSLRNESIAVGIGLLLLFVFTYVVQYCARHGYIKIPDHEDIVAKTSHEEL
ncbi:hypothetical protein HOP50_01g03670 [Chloropicon primus]|uniref:Uncharacterized protein n=1 Tax=Chloropicon primus TaxID=1764295 RepID=A0A5B8MF10_9CHLO|nr:hypothetical protein A3770_01p03780 [Chloropicon primus]UPQ97076.1 hypothetical protein HOP50_01g03670 [Chloropicon primus]|eukprot:QDZ17860.1 hypothetical protein A3770_01p03780 [Chloropicon primus]